jgi:hypothetical protein
LAVEELEPAADAKLEEVDEPRRGPAVLTEAASPAPAAASTTGRSPAGTGGDTAPPSAAHIITDRLLLLRSEKRHEHDRLNTDSQTRNNL